MEGEEAVWRWDSERGRERKKEREEEKTKKGKPLTKDLADSSTTQIFYSTRLLRK